MVSDLFCLFVSDILLPETEELRKEGHLLLFLDNFEAHLDPRVLEMAAANGVHMIAFPAHSTHILQPLDVGIMQPLKHYYTQVPNSQRSSTQNACCCHKTN